MLAKSQTAKAPESKGHKSTTKDRVNTGEHEQIVEAAQAVAHAIARQDVRALTELLAPDFVLRTPGGPVMSSAEFIAKVGEINVEITFVRREQISVDISAAGALVSGIQHAQIREDGEKFDSHRPFADWFVKNRAGQWVLQHSLDLPEPVLSDDDAD